MSEENLEIARRALDAFARRDVDAFIGLTDQDFEWRPAVSPGGMERTVYRGATGARRWFAEVDETWAKLAVEVTEIREAGEGRVLQLGRFHAVGRESGVPVDVPQAILITIVDERLVAARGFASHEEALEAAGLSEQD